MLVAVVSLWTTPQGIFAISGGVTLVAVFLALLVLKGRARSEVRPANEGFKTAPLDGGDLQEPELVNG